MSESSKLYEEAMKVLVGGVNSPVRAAIRPYPFFVREGKAHTYSRLMVSG